MFLSIDDTMMERYGTKFQARSGLFDHAAHNGSSYLDGHCFVSVMLHMPVESADGILSLSVSPGYRPWTKEFCPAMDDGTAITWGTSYQK